MAAKKAAAVAKRGPGRPRKNPAPPDEGPGFTTSEEAVASLNGNADRAVLRLETRNVDDYLKALQQQAPPRRGRRVTKESIEAKLERINAELDQLTGVARLQKMQERMDLRRRLGVMMQDTGIEDLEAGFIQSAASYSKRKGITYAAWREIGVPSEVLKNAGIGRG